MLRNEPGLEERMIKETEVGAQGLLRRREGTEMGGGRTHHKALARSQSSVHSWPPAAPRAVIVSTPGHRQGLLPPT